MGAKQSTSISVRVEYNGDTLMFTMPYSSTVGDLKKKIQATKIPDILLDDMLVFNVGADLDYGQWPPRAKRDNEHLHNDDWLELQIREE